jgi:hypothetical protein
MDSQILSVWGMVLATDALRAFSISSFFDKRYSLRSKLVFTTESSTVALYVMNDALCDVDLDVDVVKAAVPDVLYATSTRAIFDRDTMFQIVVWNIV